jgi:tetratricopeptide (TPR) repeat protein
MLTKANVALRRDEQDEAERYYLRALELAQQIGEPSSLVKAHCGLAWVYASLQQFEKAMEHGEEGVRLARKLYGLGHPSLAEALSGWAWALAQNGDIKEAISADEEATHILRTKRVADRLAHELNSLGLLYRFDEQLDLAIASLEESSQIRQRIYGSENSRSAETLANLARCYAEAGMVQRADSCYGAALPVLERLNPESIFTTWAYVGYANVRRDEGLLALADTTYARAEASLDSTNAAMLPYRAECLIEHGYLRSMQGRYDEAESMIRSGFTLLFGDDPEDDDRLGRVYVLLAAAQAGAGNTEGAMESLSRAAQCGMTAADVAGLELAELAPLRSRPDYPLANLP